MSWGGGGCRKESVRDVDSESARDRNGVWRGEIGATELKGSARDVDRTQEWNGEFHGSANGAPRISRERRPCPEGEEELGHKISQGRRQFPGGAR